MTQPPTADDAQTRPGPTWHQPAEVAAPDAPESNRASEQDLDASTGVAPTFRQPVPSGSAPPSPLDHLQPGQCVGDFELLGLLGQGAFARVYLARQLSLGRQVALKVSSNRGNEARTLASLEHDHIVHVFSEMIDPERNLRLLCMQYVPGTTLEQVIAGLARIPPASWNGRALLDAIDRLSTHPALFDPAALHDRELLGELDFPEAVCWMGARLAEALAHAHSLGVLHRDVKPPNILLNRYGRPLLADFNVSACTLHDPAAGPRSVGGTLSYMAPEHLDAFQRLLPPEAVDARSDIYALGMVLFELLTGRQPFSDTPLAPGPDYLRRLAEQRRARAPAPRQILPPDRQACVPQPVNRVVQRCLEPDPNRRYQGGTDLARALQGARELHRMERDLPPGGPLTRTALAYPFSMGTLLVLGPHVLGSLLNISYNQIHIVSALTEREKSLFQLLILLYNLAVWPVCIVFAYRLLAPLYRTWQQLGGDHPPEESQVTAMRRRALDMTFWGAVLACLGWLPGGILFPLVLRAVAGTELPGLFLHFFISFTLSGLIALTYSGFGMQYIVLRVLYPRLWVHAVDVRAIAHEELAGVSTRLVWLQVFAVIIPLSGAVLLLGAAPEYIGESAYRTLRLLLVLLISNGMIGLGMAVIASSLLSQTLSVLIGTPRPTLQSWLSPRRSQGR